MVVVVVVVASRQLFVSTCRCVTTGMDSMILGFCFQPCFLVVSFEFFCCRLEERERRGPLLFDNIFRGTSSSSSCLVGWKRGKKKKALITTTILVKSPSLWPTTWNKRQGHFWNPQNTKKSPNLEIQIKQNKKYWRKLVDDQSKWNGCSLGGGGGLGNHQWHDDSCRQDAQKIW